MAAIFAITVLAAFGLLIARYSSTGALSSAEDYLWAQALYSADSAARLNLLARDGGGNWTGAFNYPRVGLCSTAQTLDTFDNTARTGSLGVRAWADPNPAVAREIAINYRL